MPGVAAASWHQPHHPRAQGPEGPPQGRPPAFDRERYKRRNLVERCFNKLKHWRAVACRFDKRALNYRAGVVLAAIMLWLR
jgi:transposase